MNEGPRGPQDREPIDPDEIEPVAPEADPELKKGRRGDPEDSSLEPSDQTNEAGDFDERDGPR